MESYTKDLFNIFSNTDDLDELCFHIFLYFDIDLPPQNTNKFVATFLVGILGNHGQNIFGFFLNFDKKILFSALFCYS